MEEDDAHWNLLDAGLGANNPAEEALHSIKQLANGDLDAVQLLLSIGTGMTSACTDVPTSFLGKMYALISAGFVGKLYALIGTLKGIATDTYAAHRRVDKEMKDHGHYYRLQPGSGVGDVKTDACEGVGGGDTFRLFRARMAKDLEQPVIRNEISNITRELVSICRLRSGAPDQDRWERFCHGVKYACSLHGCHNADKRFTRQDLRQHIEENHPSLFDPASMDSLLDRGKQFPMYEQS